jgi:hypothetical protein
MLTCVGIFGAATVVFGLSRNIGLSMVALLLVGASDMVSVVIRSSVLQLATPPEMRGRVSAVNWLFIGASNEFGEFESGVTAHWWGAVPAVVIGGVASMVVTGVAALVFPASWSWPKPSRSTETNQSRKKAAPCVTRNGHSPSFCGR